MVVEDAMPLTPVPWGLLMDPRIRSADPDRLTRLEVCYEMKRWLLPPQSEKRLWSCRSPGHGVLIAKANDVAVARRYWSRLGLQTMETVAQPR